jgi:TolA-binding protein
LGLALVPLLGCATEVAHRSEADDLRAELHAVREANARLEARVERLETGAALDRRAVNPSAAPDHAVPTLTVIKLKPRTDPAPKIDVAVPVVEPSPEIIHDFAPTNAREPSPASEAGVTAPGGEADFEQGVAALRTGNVEGGVTRLLSFAAAHPRHSKADNALYFAGIGQMGLERYEDAARTFERLLTDHPAGDAVQDGMLRLAECHIHLNQVQDARALYAKVVASYPGTAAASQAEQRLDSLH